MSEFDRKESTKSVGELYPVLLSADGRVIDGFHRLEDNPDWKTETLEHIDSEEKLLLARAISNWHRREVPVFEKSKWINGLAKIYQEQGVATGGVAKKISEETGLHPNTVRKFLSIEYKDETQSERASGPRPDQRVPASQRIETELGADYVERHETEVEKKLLEDPEFIVRAIERAPQVLASKPVPVVDRQGYHRPTIEKKAQKTARITSTEVTEQQKALKASPELRDKSKLLKAWRALGVMLSSSKNLICPICDGQVTAILKCTSCGEIPLSEAEKIAEDAVQ